MDKEGIDAEKARHELYAALRGIAERRGYKPGWIAWKFKEITGRWPNGEAIEKAAPAAHELLAWERAERIKYRKRKREEELRLASVGSGISLRGANSMDISALMTDEDCWGVKW